MSGIWRTIRDYVLWSYERGYHSVRRNGYPHSGLHLLFAFLGQFQRQTDGAHPASNRGVVVVTDESGGLIYQIDGSTVTGKDETTVRGQLLRIIVPISGAVSITKYEVAHDRSGQATAYKVWVKRE